MSTRPPPPLRALLRDPADPARVRAVWQRVQERRRPRARVVRLALPALAVAASAAVLAIAGPWSGSAGTDDVAAGRVPTDQQGLRFADGAALRVIATGGEARERVVSLTDGTRIAVARDSRLVPRAASHRRTAFALERGSARFEVAKQGARSFEVSAGPLEVTVVGTAFSVTAGPSETLVTVEHGRVRVHSPSGDTLLGAGQSLRWPQPVAAPSTLAADPPAGRTEASATTAPTPAESVRAADARSPATAAPGAENALPRRSGAHGGPPSSHRATGAEALLQLSDAARAEGRPEQAAHALQRLLERYPRDARSPLAALTLARLQLDTLNDPRAAARSFQRALQLGLPLALREDAIAMRVRALRDAGDHAGSERAAAHYQDSYPNGRFAAEVRRWSSAP